MAAYEANVPPVRATSFESSESAPANSGRPASSEASECADRVRQPSSASSSQQSR